jgi:CheY-like chemotaxis protein
MAAGNRRKILVVDDNVGLAENIAEILGMAGHLIEVAASAEEALSKVGSSPPDVVVTDYRLPGVNGAALVRRLRQDGAPVHAIIMSGHTDDGTLEDARSAGAAFVAKPIDFVALGRLVEG